MTTAPNHAELDALLAWAEAEHEKKLKGLPSEWDQCHWAIQLPNGTPIAASCATACCLAGRQVANDGGRFLLGPGNWEGHLVASAAELPDGRTVDVFDHAQESLGLNDSQALALFDGDNTIEDVRRIVQAIKDGDPKPLSGDDYRYYNPTDDPDA